MSYELARSLLLTEVVSSAALARALFTSASQEMSLVRALLETRALEPERLEAELARVDVPVLKNVMPVRDLVDKLPAGLCGRLMAVPVRRDAMTGTIDVAVADARDPHPTREIAYWLGAPVRTIRASIPAIEEALRRSLPPQHRAPEVRAPASGKRNSTAPGWGTGPGNTLEFPPPPRVPTPIPVKGNSDLPIPLTRKAGSSLAPSPELLPGFVTPDGTEYSYDVPDDLEPAIELSRVLTQSVAPPSLSPDTERAVPSIIPGPPPITKRGPYSSSATSTPITNVAGTITALRSAYDRDEILDLVLGGARTVARKVALFIVKQRGFVGWTCSREFGDESVLQDLNMPLDVPSVLLTAVQEGLYLGPMRADDVHAPVLAIMGGATRDVATVAVKVSGRAAIIILADDLADTMNGTRRLDELARAAGEALERAVRSRK